MADLETRIAIWVDEQTAGVAPITLDEIRDRATTIPLDADPLPQPPRRFGPRPLAIAAAILILAATIGAAVLLTNNNQNNDVITDNRGQGLNRLTPLIPDDLDGMAQLVDLEELREQTGIARPAPGSSADESTAYLLAHIDNDPSALLLPSEMLGTRGGSDLEETATAFRSDMGIDLAQITAWADWGFGAGRVTILLGSFDETAVDDAAHANEWPGEMTEHEHRGVTYYGWRDEYTMTVAEASVTNQLGETRRIAVIDDIYIIARTTPHMEAAIDRALDGRSAAELTGAQAVLAALLDATGANPPEEAGVFRYDERAFTYAATAHRRALSTSTERLGAYAMTVGIDQGVPDDDIDAEVNLLIDELASSPGPLRPEPGPYTTPFDELYDHSVDGRILTITQAEPTP